MAYTSNWDNVQKKLERAALNGVDRVMADAVNHAKRLVNVDTASLQGSIKFEPAVIKGDRAHGLWGSFDINYAAAQEFGPRGKPYLRPAAKQSYRNLHKYIREEMKR